jgi:hypothetical protein
MNVGDALTFKILTDDHETTISFALSLDLRFPVRPSTNESYSIQTLIHLFNKTGTTKPELNDFLR